VESFDRIWHAAAQIPRQITSITYGCFVLISVVRGSQVFIACGDAVWRSYNPKVYLIGSQ